MRILSCLRVHDQVEAGEEMVITRRGQPDECPRQSRHQITSGRITASQGAEKGNFGPASMRLGLPGRPGSPVPRTAPCRTGRPPSARVRVPAGNPGAAPARQAGPGVLRPFAATVPMPGTWSSPPSRCAEGVERTRGGAARVPGSVDAVQIVPVRLPPGPGMLPGPGHDRSGLPLSGPEIGLPKPGPAPSPPGHRRANGNFRPPG